MNKLAYSATGILVGLVLFVGLNVLSARTLRATRLDLTERKLYTLSEGSDNVLKQLDEPITLRFYFSRNLAGDLPQFESYAKRIEDLLIEYERRSSGMLKVEFLDPEPFSAVEERAIQFGLSGVPVGKASELFYFGLVGTNTLDDEETIPFFQIDKENVLEYDVTKLIFALSDPTLPVIGIMSTLPIEGTFDPMTRRPPQPWIIVDQLKQFFDVQTVPPTVSEIPADVDVLMLVHPKDLADETLFAIDQFVLGGGNAMVFVDPHCEEDVPPADPSNPMAAMTANRSSDLNRLFEPWGLKLAENVFAADKVNALVVPFRSRDGGRYENVPYVAYLTLGEDSYNPAEVITNQLGALRLGTAGVLEALPDAVTEITPLVETSTESMRVDVSRVKFAPDPIGLLDEFFPTGQKLMLAARITGTVSTAFPDGRPTAPETATEDDLAEEPDDAEVLTESQGAINVVVVADADMLADRWWVQVQDLLGMQLLRPTADNLNLVTNALDNLSGSNDLISLRGRAGFERPFTEVERLEREANDKFRDRARALEEELRATEERINQLQNERDGGSSLILTPEQEAELDSFRDKQVQTKRELRDVRYELRRDIDSLHGWLKVLNVWMIPALLLAFGVGSWFFRSRN